MDRDNWRCGECGKAGKLEVHHVRPVYKAPELELSFDNVVTLCRNCHLAHTRKDKQQVSPQRQAWRELVEALFP